MRNSNEVRQLAALLVDPRLDGLPQDPDKVSRPGLAGRIHISHQTSVKTNHRERQQQRSFVHGSFRLAQEHPPPPPLSCWSHPENVRGAHTHPQYRTY